ncbi:MAG: hypothetical protein ACXIVQ_14780 [Acidimicrobiales bacterium]
MSAEDPTATSDTTVEPPEGEQFGRFEGAAFLATGAGLVAHILFDVWLWLSVLTAVTGAALVLDLARRRHPKGLAAGRRQLLIGFAAAAVAVIAYDVSRLFLVNVLGFHIDPFKAFPFFGAGLIGQDASNTAHWIAGTVFHFVNGITFGIAYTIWLGRRGVVWGIGYGLGLEAIMIGLYPAWLQIDAMAEFTTVSVFGHIAYGAALGYFAKRWLERADV